MIARMRSEPGANHDELSAIEAHITQGVHLPLLAEPAAVTYDNTPTVQQHANDVRRRLAEYMQFGAVTRLPGDGHLTDPSLRVQPLHVIIKAGKKPRLVIDLSRNLNQHLQYEYFQYSCVDDAVEASHPGCWYGKLDLSNCFLSFRLLPAACRFFCFRFEGELYQFTHMPVRPEHSAARLHAAAVSRPLRAAEPRHPRRPLPGRLLPHRRHRGGHGAATAAGADGHSAVRPRRQPRQNRRASASADLPGRAARLSQSDAVVHARARDSADGAHRLAPPPARHPTRPRRVAHRQALVRGAGATRRASFHATHAGRLPRVQIAAAPRARPHRPRLPRRPALLGAAATNLERQRTVALSTSGSIHLRLRRQPPRLRLLSRVNTYAARRYGRLRVNTYAAWQYGRRCGVAPTPPGRGDIQRDILP